MKTRRKPKVEKTHNKHSFKVYKNIYKPLCIKAFLEGPEGRNDAHSPPWHLSPTHQCCEWHSALKGNRKPRPWPAAAFLEGYQGSQERADVNLCLGWLQPAHFPRSPIFLGAFSSHFPRACWFSPSPAQHSTGNTFIPEDAVVTE